MPKDGEDGEGPEETMIPTQVQMQDKQMEQQQAQLDQQQQQQDADRDAQVEIEKERAKHPQPAQTGAEPQPGEKQPAGKGQPAEARRHSIQAASAPADPDTKPADNALLESIQPMLDRLEAIKAVKDSGSRKKLLQKFIRDHESLTAALLHDPSLAKAVTPAIVQKFVEGLKSKGTKP
jgi:hypothetical protein